MRLATFVAMVSTLAAANAGAAQPSKALAFQDLKSVFALASRETLTGNPVSYVLSGEACNSLLKETRGGGGSPANVTDYTIRWAEYDTIEMREMVVPILTFANDDGDINVLFDSVKDAQRAADDMITLRRLCRG